MGLRIPTALCGPDAVDLLLHAKATAAAEATATTAADLSGSAVYTGLPRSIEWVRPTAGPARRIAVIPMQHSAAKRFRYGVVQ